jgi:ATP-binding cassette subfamily F protein uup
VVSHDRYFLERVCDRSVAMYGDGALVDLPGGIDAYLERLRHSGTMKVAAPDRAPRGPGAAEVRNPRSRLAHRLPVSAAAWRRKPSGWSEPSPELDAARVPGNCVGLMAQAATDHCTARPNLAADLRGLQGVVRELEPEWMDVAAPTGLTDWADPRAGADRLGWSATGRTHGRTRRPGYPAP